MQLDLPVNLSRFGKVWLLYFQRYGQNKNIKRSKPAANTATSGLLN
jgi:hypothetical protein